MNKHLSSTFGIAYINVRNNLKRSIWLIILTGILSFVLFGGTILIQSLGNGLSNMKERLGADIMIVPVENESDFEAVLLKGEPSCFYFGRSLEQKVSGLEGVGSCTSQFYLTSLDAECCDTRVQIIGFDPETDFSVKPWISKVYDGELEEGAVVIGNDIHLENSDSIKLFGTEYKVAAKLDATGTGLDQAVYASTETIRGMYEAALLKGQRFLDDVDPDKSISTILIKAKEGTDRAGLIRNIRRELGGVKIIESQSMISGTAANMKEIAILLYVFAGLFLLTTIGVLVVVFSIIAGERKKEFAVLRTLGATKKKLARIVLSESVIISSIGGILGIIAAAAIVFPFQVYIGDKLGMPYLLPSPLILFLIFVAVLLTSFLIGPLTAASSAVKISRAETYITMREGE